MSSTPNSGRPVVLVLIKGLGIGGAERLISQGAQFWDRSRFDYRLAYVLPWKDQLVEPLTEQGVEVTCVGGNGGEDPLTPLRLTRVIKRWDPDLIHAHLPAAGILARVSTSRPIVYTEHNVAHSYRWSVRTLNRLTYRRNRVVIAVSDAVSESLATYPGPSPIVIPNGVVIASDGPTSRIREELDLDPDSQLVVHVGNIRPHKGHANLIQAVAELSADFPEAVFVSVGAEKRSGDLERIRKLAADAGVESQIRFLGRRPDATDFMAAANVVVNPSDYEGLPLAVLEALSLRRPVVATDVGGVSSVVVNERTGLLVPPREPKLLAEAIARALTSPEAEAWGNAGAALVAERHGLEGMIRSYEKLYHEILAA